MKKLALVLAIVGCSVQTEPETEPVCDAGRVASCPCDSGEDGSQECESDGSAWGECLCPGEQPRGAAGAAPVSTMEVCDGFRDPQDLAPEERCPDGTVIAYTFCPKELIQSGVCVRLVDTSWYCCTR